MAYAETMITGTDTAGINFSFQRHPIRFMMIILSCILTIRPKAYTVVLLLVIMVIVAKEEADCMLQNHHHLKFPKF